MRFESVTAYAFGPFDSGESLEFAPGMNVIFGANESGKSSWHAALYAGLCGVRNYKGAPKKKEREFESLRRPWGGDAAWEVGVVVRLADEDERCIELRQNLAAKSGKAVDPDIANRDFTSEISQTGTPDGARWLGLDRTMFLSTACVTQAEMLSVRDGAQQLQGALQAAADNAERDATAAQALLALEEFRRTEVGSSRAWTKPLPKARTALADATRALEDAREKRNEQARRHEGVRKCELLANSLQRRVLIAEAGRTAAAAKAAQERLTKAQGLQGEFPDGQPKASKAEAELAGEIERAVVAWEATAAPDTPTGDTVQELQGQLAAAEDELRKQTPASPERKRTAWRKYGGATLVIAVAAMGFAAWQLQETGLALGAAFTALFGFFALRQRIGRAEAAVEAQHTARLELEERIARFKERIDRRKEEDVAFDAARSRYTDAENHLRRTAEAAGLQERDPDAQAHALRRWRERWLERVAQADRRNAHWGELQSVLAGQTVEDIQRMTDDTRQRADAALQSLGTVAADEHELMRSAAQGRYDLEKLAAQRRAADHALAEAHGGLEEFLREVPSVADAEDEHDEAERRLAHFEALDRTLEQAIKFLERAERRIHRDVARTLRMTLRTWLPKVTAKRYVDAKVDPESLAVEVRTPDGDWQAAERLSHGTKEQIYLLLRLALTRHLVRHGETCPLLLDDPVSASDAGRRTLILETLLAVADTTQVILFTHDEDVRMWASRHLKSTANHRFLELGPAR